MSNFKFHTNYPYHIVGNKRELFPKLIRLYPINQTPLKMEINVRPIASFWPTSCSKLVQKGMFVPNLKKWRPLERRYKFIKGCLYYIVCIIFVKQI